MKEFYAAPLFFIIFFAVIFTGLKYLAMHHGEEKFNIAVSNPPATAHFTDKVAPIGLTGNEIFERNGENCNSREILFFSLMQTKNYQPTLEICFNIDTAKMRVVKLSSPAKK